MMCVCCILLHESHQTSFKECLCLSSALPDQTLVHVLQINSFCLFCYVFSKLSWLTLTLTCKSMMKKNFSTLFSILCSHVLQSSFWSSFSFCVSLAAFVSTFTTWCISYRWKWTKKEIDIQSYLFKAIRTRKSTTHCRNRLLSTSRLWWILPDRPRRTTPKTRRFDFQ